MRDAYILSGGRTPIGKFRGGLASVSAVDLGARVVKAVAERARLQPKGVDEVILGCVLAAGLGQAPARQASLRAGLAPETGALTINMVCGSGLRAVTLAAQAVRCSDAEIVVAGGMENMSQAAYVLPRDSGSLGDRTLIDTLKHDGLMCASSDRSMGDIAEGLAQQLGLTRRELDEYALESHRRACAAAAAGHFRDELIPVMVGEGERARLVDTDEGPRPDTSLEQLAALPPAFRKDGLVTAGNSSMISDGAAAVVVGSEAAARRHGLKPLARIVASATAGGPPEELFIAPVEAIRRVLARAHRSHKDVDLFEINEAFAAQMLACLRGLELPPERVNVHGGAIALGHPIGASGARVLVTLLSALRSRDLSVGVAALCLGGGNAVAMLVERC
jgi:acetyl-CoA C-acetyltransferase